MTRRSPLAEYPLRDMRLVRLTKGEKAHVERAYGQGKLTGRVWEKILAATSFHATAGLAAAHATSVRDVTKGLQKFQYEARTLRRLITGESLTRSSSAPRTLREIYEKYFEV